MIGRAWLAPLTLMLALPAAAQDEAWLQRLHEAQRQQSFSGTFIHQRGSSLTSSRLWQRVEGAERQMRLLRLDGEPQEQVRRNGRPLCGSGGEALESPLLTAVPVRLGPHYRVTVQGKARIAGREAQVLRLQPDDAHRYAGELFLDQVTGLPLKRVLFDARGVALDNLQFADFSLQMPEPAEVQASADCKQAPSAPAVDEAARWRAGWLPAGFALLSASRESSPVSGQPVLVQLYGDGLVHLSVFVEGLQALSASNAHSQAGPTAIASRRRDTAAGTVMLTVLGEVPPATVERVLLALRAPGEEP